MAGGFLGALSRLFQRAPSEGDLPSRPEARFGDFRMERSLTLSSGILGIGSSSDRLDVALSEESRTWALFRGTQADGECCVALIAAELSDVGAIVEQPEGVLSVEDGLVHFADAELLETEAIRRVLEREDRDQPSSWPKNFFLTSTGRGDGGFPVSAYRAAAPSGHGVLAVQVSFSAAASPQVLQQLAATLPRPKRRAPKSDPLKSQAVTRNTIGRWTLRLQDSAALSAALRTDGHWALGALSVVAAQASKVSATSTSVQVELAPDLLQRLAREVEQAKAGARLSWDELPDFEIERL